MNSLILSTIILLVFTILTAGSYYHGDTVGMFNILTAWRFFVSQPCPVFPDGSNRLAGRHRHWRRIPSWQRGMRRVNERAQVWNQKHVVHFVH
jgi:hypothetical protein